MIKSFFYSVKTFNFKQAVKFCILSLVLFCGLGLMQPSFAANVTAEVGEEVIQPFKMTKPAESREEAYEEAAKVIEDPAQLIKAQNQEIKAEEKATNTPGSLEKLAEGAQELLGNKSSDK